MVCRARLPYLTAAPRIAAFYADGRPVTNLPPGTYTIQVHDLSAAHNFHLTGPGVDEKTSVGDIEHPVWRLTLRVGKYTFKVRRPRDDQGQLHRLDERSAGA